ncbi:hypothetical protein HWB91_gp30 [Bacillus phage vB_BboS-125]|uniref:Uncharacterized protein n=1 Tax=Bacillus phage vB_BboS-125 TaxID=2419618 RepID=A0A3G3BW60_9CAUD|nr:hypothetical protein HWB91_gp30 [Bacillus phage vB_BboS-125]AYP68400.1 hypothetical protein BboS125_00030 [Bacillus phage vB_BboS-125]
MTLAERLLEAQRKDVEEMDRIIKAAEAGTDPAEACSQVVGGKYNLSEFTAAAIKGKGAVTV